jgi:hypothetical protein
MNDEGIYNEETEAAFEEAWKNLYRGKTFLVCRISCNGVVAFLSETLRHNTW